MSEEQPTQPDATPEPHTARMVPTGREPRGFLHERALLLGGALSLFVHGLVSAPAWLGLNQSLKIPEFKLEFETVDMVEIVAPELEQAEVPQDEPASSSAPETAPEPEQKPKADEPKEDEGEKKAEQEKKKEKPKRKLGDRKSNVDRLGPANSRVYALLATRRVARLPYAEQAIQVLEPWPDFEFIVRGAGFHPLRDFNAIAIASSDMRDASQTFLAVDSRLSTEELKAGIERAAARRQEQISWEQRQGITIGNPRPIDPRIQDWDPRYFAFIDKRTAVYVREEFLPSILKGPKAGGKKSSGNFVANISRLRRFVAKDPNAGLQLVLKDIRASIKSAQWPFPFEIPNGLEVFAGAQKEPELLVRIEFLGDGQAEIAKKYWEKEIGDAIRSSLAYRYMVGPLYSATKVSIKGKVLTLTNTFTTAQAKLLLGELGKLSARQMRKSPEEMAKARQERQQMWKRRKGGKVPPSKALQAPAP